MAINRQDDVVETEIERAPTVTIEERVVQPDGTVRSVVRTVGEYTPATTSHTTVGGHGGQPSLYQYRRVTWVVVGLVVLFGWWIAGRLIAVPMNRSVE